MNEAFEFVTTRSQGLASAGLIVGASDSLANTCRLLVDPTRIAEGMIEPKDSIVVYAISSSARFEAFRGIVSKIVPNGGMYQIEGVTESSYALVDPSPVASWENTTAQRVLMDLLSVTRLNITNVSVSSILSDAFLHTWHTEGRSVAEEVQALLASVAPGVRVFGSLDGRTIIGTREEIAKMFGILVYPSDDAGGETDTEVSRFSLRVGFPGTTYLDHRGRFFGTLDSVVHKIAPGVAYTDLILDDTWSDDLAAWATSPAQKSLVVGNFDEEEL